MMGGDISNETPPRLVVLIDVVCASAVEEGKFFKSRHPQRKFTSLRKAELSRLWILGDRFGLSIQLAAFAEEGWDPKEIARLMEKLDNRGGNPFNYSEVYQDTQELVDELPYLPNLKGVVDVRERVARYGSWGIELNSL
jgi:hypothetical protein